MVTSNFVTDTRKSMVAIARAAAQRASVNVPLWPPVLCCEVYWSSDPDALAQAGGGWTRTGRCGKCRRDLRVQA